MIDKYTLINITHFNPGVHYKQRNGKFMRQIPFEVYEKMKFLCISLMIKRIEKIMFEMRTHVDYVIRTFALT